MTATQTESRVRRVIGALVPDPRRADSVRLLVEGRPLLTVPRKVAVVASTGVAGWVVTRGW